MCVCKLIHTDHLVHFKNLIGELNMTDELEALLEKAKKVEMNPDEQEQQRRSFAYGNTHFENKRISRQTIDEVAEMLKMKNG
jgi:hypothetical protein